MTKKPICPICRKPLSAHEPAGDGSFPFCSERCRLVDLGHWFEGDYAIGSDQQRPEPEENDKADKA